MSRRPSLLRELGPWRYGAVFFRVWSSRLWSRLRARCLHFLTRRPYCPRCRALLRCRGRWVAQTESDPPHRPFAWGFVAATCAECRAHVWIDEEAGAVRFFVYSFVFDNAPELDAFIAARADELDGLGALHETPRRLRECVEAPGHSTPHALLGRNGELRVRR